MAACAVSNVASSDRNVEKINISSTAIDVCDGGEREGMRVGEVDHDGLGGHEDDTPPPPHHAPPPTADSQRQVTCLSLCLFKGNAF
jgi:hypothetical protein